MSTSTPISSFLKRVRIRPQFDPTRDWITALIIATIALAGITVWNAWAFDTVVSGGVIGASATSTPPFFSQSSLDAIHTVFANRAAEEGKYISGAYSYVDPSL